jgi:hypothetical protein
MEKRVSGTNDLLLSMIRECIRQRRYAFTTHALTKHPLVEGFTPRQAIEAISNGDVIEHYPEQSRCLIAGTASGLVISKDYITTYIHCVCRYDNINQMVIITMYRPKSDEWVNHARRKPGVGGR